MATMARQRTSSALATPEDISRAEASVAPQRETLQQFQTEESRLMGDGRRTEEDALKAKEARDIAVKEAEATQLGLSAEQQRGLTEKTQREIEKNPFPTFKPSQEDAISYSQLGSLVGTLGMMLGGGAKGSAKVAIGAMTGMMKGWQSGRKDLWEREVKTFDKEVQRIKSVHDSIYKDLDMGLKQLATDREAGRAKLMAAAWKAGTGSVIATMIQNGRAQDALKIVREGYKLTSDIDKRVQDLAIAQRRHEQQQAAQAAQRAATIEAARIRAASPGRIGQNALTFASRVYGNILNASADLKNLTILPQTAESPLLSGMINTEPATALGSIRAFAGRQITSPDARAFDQVSNSLDAALARLEAQGVASGATQGAIRSFNALKPKAGDPALNMAMYIARVKQEIETGIRVHREMPGATENQKAEAIQELQKINKIIPFSVDDVLSVARSGRGTLNEKMRNLVQKPSVAQGIQYQGLSPLDVDATQQTDKSYPAASSRKAMPSGTKLTEYARTYFNGDEGQAKQYLTTQGYE